MTPLSSSPAQGYLTSGEGPRVSSNETDLPTVPLKGGNGCSSCGLHALRGGKGARKSYRKKSNRKTRRAARKTRRNRRL